MDVYQEFDNYLKVKGYSNVYLNNIKPYLLFITVSRKDIYNINLNDLLSYLLDQNQRGIGKGRINNLIKAIKFFYIFLFETGKVSDIVLGETKKLKQVQEDKKLYDYLDEKEMYEFIGRAASYIKRIEPIKLKAILYFMFYTGVRRNEIINLKRADIDLINNEAIIRVPTKNNWERKVYFPPKVTKILNEYFAVEPEDINAFNLTINKIQYLMSKLSKYLPVGKHITARVIRHSFGNLLVDKRIGVRVAQKLLGHRSMQSTLVYYDPDDKLVKKLYKESVR